MHCIQSRKWLDRLWIRTLMFQQLISGILNNLKIEESCNRNQQFSSHLYQQQVLNSDIGIVVGRAHAHTWSSEICACLRTTTDKILSNHRQQFLIILLGEDDQAHVLVTRKNDKGCNQHCKKLDAVECCNVNQLMLKLIKIDCFCICECLEVKIHHK